MRYNRMSSFVGERILSKSAISGGAAYETNLLRPEGANSVLKKARITRDIDYFYGDDKEIYRIRGQ